jgi:hypothetical protein
MNKTKRHLKEARENEGRRIRDSGSGKHKKI